VSNGRRSGRANTYRTGYLKSVAWFRRRNEWFDMELSLKGTLQCEVCEHRYKRAELQLHHLDYRGAQRTEGAWIAAENHDELIALDAACHEALHRLIDRDLVLRWHRARPAATALAITALQRRLTKPTILGAHVSR